MSGFVVASSWDHAPVSSVSPPYASRDGLGRPPNAVIDVQDPQLHAPVTFALTDLEPTAGLQSKLSSRAAGGSGGPTFRVCEPHITLECPLGSECADAHVSRAALSDVRTSILKWLADKEHEFGQQVASSTHNPISYKIFCSDLKEIVDVPVTSITFTRGLFADPGVRTNKRQTASSAQGSSTGVSGKAADVNSAAASTPTACGLFASDPTLCKWGKWCNQAHIDPQFLTRRKQVFNQWAMGHESTFNTMPPDAVFLVHDPVIKRSVDVKRHDIAEFTRGLFQQSGATGCGSPNSRKAPSLCLLYQKRRCTAGTCCNQIHVKPEAVTVMRMASPQNLGDHVSSTGGPSQRQKHNPFGHNPNNGNTTNNSHLHHLGHQQSGGDGGKRNVPGGANNVFAPGNFHVNSGSPNGFVGGHGGGGFVVGANHQHPHPHMYSDPFGSPTTAMGINGFVGQPPQMNGDGRGTVHQHFFPTHPNPNTMGMGNYSNNPSAPSPNHFPHSAYGQGPRPAGGGFPAPIGMGGNQIHNRMYHGGGGGAPPPTGLSPLYPSPSTNGHDGVGMNMRANNNNHNGNGNGNDTNTLTQHQRMYHNPQQGQHYHQNNTTAPPPSSTNSSAAPQLGGNVQPPRGGSFLNQPTLMKTHVSGNPNRHLHPANYPQQQQQREQDRSGNAPFVQPHSSGSPSNNMPPHPVSAPVAKSFHPHQGAVHQGAVSPKDDMAYTGAAQQRHPKAVADGATRLGPQKSSNTDGNGGAPNSDGAVADSEQDLHFNHATLLKSVTKLSPDTLNDSQVATSSTEHPLVTNANNISINNNSLASPIAQSTSAEDAMALPRMTLGDRENSAHHSAPARPESGNGNAPKPPPQPLASAFQTQSSTSQNNLVIAPRSADPLETSLSGTPGLGSSGVMRKRNNPYEPAPQRMASPTSPPQRPEAPNAAYNLSNSSFTGVGVNNSFINHLVANSPNASRGHRPVGDAGVGGGAYAPGSPLSQEGRYQQGGVGGFSQSHARAPSGNQHQHFNQSLGQRPPSRQTSYIGPAPEFSFTPLLGANNAIGNDSFNFDPVVFGSFAEHPDANAGNQGPAMSESFAMRPDIGSGRVPHQRHALHSGNTRPNNAASAGRWNAPGANVGM